MLDDDEGGALREEDWRELKLGQNELQVVQERQYS